MLLEENFKLYYDSVSASIFILPLFHLIQPKCAHRTQLTSTYEIFQFSSQFCCIQFQPHSLSTPSSYFMDEQTFVINIFVNIKFQEAFHLILDEYSSISLPSSLSTSLPRAIPASPGNRIYII